MTFEVRLLLAAVLMAIGAAAATMYWRSDLARERARADQLAADLGAQAEGVKLLKQAASQREMAAREAQRAAEAESRQHLAAAQDLLQRRPPPGIDVCSAAEALIREELGR